MISYGCQDIALSDVDAVTAILISDIFLQDSVVTKFQKSVSEFVGVEYQHQSPVSESVDV